MQNIITPSFKVVAQIYLKKLKVIKEKLEYEPIIKMLLMNIKLIVQVHKHTKHFTSDM